MILVQRVLMAGSLMALAGAAACVSASAQTFQQRQDRDQVSEHIADANRTCGTNVALTVDWNSFAGAKSAPENTNAQSAWAFIVNATDALDAVCRESAEDKAMIANNLRAIRVSHTAAEQMSYRNGVLTYGVPYTGAAYNTLEKYMLNNIGGAGVGQGKPVKSVIDGLKQRLNFPN